MITTQKLRTYKDSLFNKRYTKPFPTNNEIVLTAKNALDIFEKDTSTSLDVSALKMEFSKYNVYISIKFDTSSNYDTEMDSFEVYEKIFIDDTNDSIQKVLIKFPILTSTNQPYYQYNLVEESTNTIAVTILDTVLIGYKFINTEFESMINEVLTYFYQMTNKQLFILL